MRGPLRTWIGAAVVVAAAATGMSAASTGAGAQVSRQALAGITVEATTRGPGILDIEVRPQGRTRPVTCTAMIRRDGADYTQSLRTSAGSRVKIRERKLPAGRYLAVVTCTDRTAGSKQATTNAVDVL